MKTWFQRLLHFNQSPKEKEITVSLAGASVMPAPEREPWQPFTAEDAIRVINERSSVDQYIMLRGHLYCNVILEIQSRGHVPYLAAYGDNFNSLPFPTRASRIAEEHVPKEESDIQPPPQWIDNVGATLELIALMESVRLKTATAINAVRDFREPTYIITNNSLVPLLKLYENNDWIIHGWKGPAIVITDAGDEPLAEAKGVIPDNLEVLTLKQVCDEITAFLPIVEAMDRTMHHSVERFYREHEAFLKFLQTSELIYT